MEAIGTLLAVFVALYLGLKPIMENEKNKPKLEMYTEKVDDLYYWTAKNVGVKTALNVNFKIRSLVYGQGKEAVKPDFYDAFKKSMGNLQSGDIKTVRVFQIRTNLITSPLSGTLNPYLKEGLRSVTIEITGDNITPIREKYVIKENKFEKK